MSSTAITDTDVFTQLGRLLRRLGRATGGEEGLPLTTTQGLVLAELHDAGPMRLREVAARAGVSAPTASRAVDHLELVGLVERATDTADRRAIRIGLTLEGRRLVKARRARAAAAFAPASAALSADERQKLLDLLERMTDALGDER
jgi:DNA-binding MarR family transcriptional regulator